MNEILLHIQSPQGDKDVTLHDGRVIIGRGDTAQVQLNDRGLSRQHASIYRDGERVWILDEGSINGSRVNGQAIPAAGLPLSNGDEIRMGEETVITVEFRSGQVITPEKPAGATGISPLQLTAFAALAVVFLGGIIALGLHLRSRRVAAPADPPVTVELLPSRAASPSATPVTPEPGPSLDLAIATPSVFPADDPEPSQAAKRYQQMSEAEKLEFIDRRARHITRMMGNREYAFDQESLGYIKSYVDNYARRVGNGSTRIWGEDLRYMFERAQSLAPFIIHAFDQHGVPRVVGLYIPMIESEYRPCLESPVGAKGLFQFMGATAEGYGVPASERCNVERMAPAAAKYMRDRISEFGTDAMSVALGIAGYNRSPDSVRRDLQNVIDQKNNERSFWTLVSRQEDLDHYFQRENIKYVPKFFAAAIVGETPAAFGLDMKKLSTND